MCVYIRAIIVVFIVYAGRMEGSARKNPTTAVTAVRDGGGGRRLPDFRFPFGKKKGYSKKKKRIEYTKSSDETGKDNVPRAPVGSKKR